MDLSIFWNVFCYQVKKERSGPKFEEDAKVTLYLEEH